MSFPTTQTELLPLLGGLGIDASHITNVELHVEHGGRLFLAITTAATLDGRALIGTDGDAWETVQYLPFDRLAGE